MPFIASINLLTLIVAAVGGVGLVLARRLRSGLDILAYSPLLFADGSVVAQCPDIICDTLTGQGTLRVQMQPTARPDYPRARKPRSPCLLRLPLSGRMTGQGTLRVQMQPTARPDYPRARKPRSTCLLRLPLSGRKAAPCPTVGPLSSESTVPTLRRLRCRLIHACSDCACLPVVPCSHLLCMSLSGAPSLQAVPERPLLATPTMDPLSSKSIVPMLRRLRRRLTPAQTVPVWLWCQTSRASASLSSGPSLRA